VLQLLALLVH